MAKISANGCHEVARLNFTMERGHTGILLLRSDGKLLERCTGDLSTAYRVVGTAKDKATLVAKGRGMLERFAHRRNYVTKVA